MGIDIYTTTQLSFDPNYLPPPARDPDTTAFMNAVGGFVDSPGFTYFTGTPQEITGRALWDAQDAEVLALKAAGVWSKLDFYYPFIGNTAAQHKWNLKDPRDLDAAYRVSWFGGMTHSETGAQGNGTNGWGNTHFDHSTDGDCFFGHYCRTNTQSLKYVIGAYDSTNTSQTTIASWTSFGGGRTFARILEDNLGALQKASPIVDGFGWTHYSFIQSPIEYKIYNEALTTPTTLTTGITYRQVNAELGIFCRNFNYSTAQFDHDDKEYSTIYKGSGTLTDSEVDQIETLIVNKQTALFRNV